MLPGGLSAGIYALRIIKRISQLQILTVNKFYTKYAHGFFFLDVVFPSPLGDNHFRVAIEPYHYGRIIFFIRPLENLIGRRFPQCSTVTFGNAVLIHDNDVTYCRNRIRFQRGFYVPRDTFYIQFYFTMSFYC